MPASDLHVVTGAFGYSGRYIAGRLLQRGCRVRTLTNHPKPRDAMFFQVQTLPFTFDSPKALVENLRGVRVVYNTYWIRFRRGEITHDVAVKNSQTLIRAAAEAGVERFVHVSITNPSEDSPLPYFRGKAAVERALTESGLSYAVLRPAVFFGGQDILLNNIAWLLRTFPFFPVFGTGKYGLQPSYVDDLATLAVDMGEKRENVILDAVGPEVFTFEELVRLIGRHVGRPNVRIVHAPPALAFAAAKVLGVVQQDVMITRDEMKGLMGGLLVSKEPPSLPTRLSEWLKEHGPALGKDYHSELEKHYK